jgi:hypothetical protein
LKNELRSKEVALNDQSKSYKLSLQKVSHELAVARKAQEDLAERFLLVEEEKEVSVAVSQRAAVEIGLLRKSVADAGVEVQNWQTAYADLEKVLTTLKAQTSASVAGLTREITGLQDMLNTQKNEAAKLRSELVVQTKVITSLADDVASITSIAVPTSVSQLYHYRAEVVAVVRSMKRYILDLNDNNAISPVSIAMFKRIVAYIDELTHRSLSYQEGLVERTNSSNEEARRTAELEQKADLMKRDLHNADNAVEHMIQLLQGQGFLCSVDTIDLRAANRGSARIDTIGSEVGDIVLCTLLR